MTHRRHDHIVRIAIAVLICASTTVKTQQAPTPAPTGLAKHITIPALANATKPSDLDYVGAECDIDATGKKMECEFQQVFLTVGPFDAQTCLVTTNRYARTFQNKTATQWVSTEGPEGECGVLDVTTLQSEGPQWTMEAHKVVTKKDASPACRDVDETPEVMSWRNTRRALPCRFVLPGAISP
jgi:hypothetical protein